MELVISGYGKEKKTISLFSFVNDEIKHLDDDDLYTPSFVTFGDNYVYTYENKENSILCSYEIVEHKLKKVDTFVLPGGNLTHLTYSSKNHCLYGCSYKEGTYFVISVSNGKFMKLICFEKQSTGLELSRCHCVFLNEEEDVLGIVNISLDKIFLYHIKANKVEAFDVISLDKGIGPRHALFLGKYIYCVTEYSNELLVISLSEKKIIARQSTIPYFHEESYGATLVFSKDKKFVYVTNRGEDTIAKFCISDHLTYMKSYSCGGKHPRHMIMSKDGKYIINCNKNSNNVTFFSVDDEKIVKEVTFFEPSGIIEI